METSFKLIKDNINILYKKIKFNKSLEDKKDINNIINLFNKINPTLKEKKINL